MSLLMRAGLSALTVVMMTVGGMARAEVPADLGVAILGGGCFWCIEADLEKVPGVTSVVSGYSGGTTTNPTYEDVSAGRGGHVEVVEVRYDPAVIGYKQLLDIYWRRVDPTVENRQFCDRGPHYRTVIYTLDDEQRRIAIASRAALDEAGILPGPIKTEIAAAGPFYPAEDYHQDYAKKNPLRYGYYRRSCGRDQRLAEVWAKEVRR